MKPIFYIPLVLLLFSCNTEIKDENLPTSKLEALVSLAEDTITTEPEIEKPEINTEIVLKARGSEPGWYAEFYDFKVLLVLNYGKDSLTMQGDFTDLKKSKKFEGNFKETINKTNYELKVSIKKENCTEEASGDKKEQSILLTLNDKQYKGCAGSN